MFAIVKVLIVTIHRVVVDFVVSFCFISQIGFFILCCLWILMARILAGEPPPRIHWNINSDVAHNHILLRQHIQRFSTNIPRRNADCVVSPRGLEECCISTQNNKQKSNTASTSTRCRSIPMQCTALLTVSLWK